MSKKSKIEKYIGGEIQPQCKEYIEKELGVDGLNIGDIFIVPDSSHLAVKVTNIVYKENDYPNQDVCYKVIIFYKESKDWELSDWENEQQNSFNDFKYHFITNGQRVKLGENLFDYRDKALKFIKGESEIEEMVDGTDETNPDTALISKNSKESLNQLQRSLEDKKNQAEIIKSFVSIEMKKKKQELDKIRERLNGVIQVFEKKIKKIMRVITTIELYLGIDEELFQIQEGQLASKDTPLSFRQQVLYMDEEVGVYEKGGLDYEDIGWFDNWLIQDNNYKRLLPEEKGLIVFRPRRYDKEYGGSAWYNAQKNKENQLRTYLLIRNGDCLYRVYTENIIILPRLFPKKDELQKLMNEINKNQDSFFSEEKKQENVDDLIYQYKKRAFLLQGLVDRTEVFHPLPTDKINIFDMSNLDGMVNFIYDDEATLPSGRLSFWEWHKEINKSIGKGSRVLLTGIDRRNDDVRGRLYYYCNEHNTPDSPNIGVYEVEEFLNNRVETMKRSDFEKLKVIWDERGITYKIISVDKDQYHINYSESNFPRTEKPGYVPIYEDGLKVESDFIDLTILYNPGDTVYGSWGNWESHERKKRVRIRIFPEDKFILNYDQISLDDINFYINSRVDRPNYLNMLPLLNDIKKWRLDELKNEKFFSEMVYSQVYTSKKFKGKSEDDIYKLIWESIDWWKFKNMWKRPIEKDDAKALRMIVKKLLKLE